MSCFLYNRLFSIIVIPCTHKIIQTIHTQLLYPSTTIRCTKNTEQHTQNKSQNYFYYHIYILIKNIYTSYSISKQFRSIYKCDNILLIRTISQINKVSFIYFISLTFIIKNFNHTFLHVNKWESPRIDRANVSNLCTVLIQNSFVISIRIIIGNFRLTYHNAFDMHKGMTYKILLATNG